MLHELSSSTRFVEVTDALRESLERDAEALPITFDAVRRLNAEEPYRLKLSFIRVRLLAHPRPARPRHRARAGSRLRELRRAAGGPHAHP